RLHSAHHRSKTPCLFIPSHSPQHFYIFKVYSYLTTLLFLSPVIQKIRQDCSREFVDFERCLRENPDKPTSCSSHVARFLGCAETVDLSGVGESFSCNSTCTTQGAIETINTHTHTGKETTQKKYQYSDFCTSYSKKTHWFSFLNSRLKFHNP
uniref:IMS import disulfide relay-system CHCH-CHCH-like Cx9C domain-containing protein n=1 Tax=Gasterosteus aculeatus aculeatus TaxID=481459 RepID=A0AAQ4QEG3_GASAC